MQGVKVEFDRPGMAEEAAKFFEGLPCEGPISTFNGQPIFTDDMAVRHSGAVTAMFNRDAETVRQRVLAYQQAHPDQKIEVALTPLAA